MMCSQRSFTSQSVRDAKERVLQMGLLFSRRVPLKKRGLLRTWLNLSTRGVSGSARVGRFTVNSRGRVTVRLRKGLSFRL
jgi:hypothetical protein